MNQAKIQVCMGRKKAEIQLEARIQTRFFAFEAFREGYYAGKENDQTSMERQARKYAAIKVGNLAQEFDKAKEKSTCYQWATAEKILDRLDGRPTNCPTRCLPEYMTGDFAAWAFKEKDLSKILPEDEMQMRETNEEGKKCASAEERKSAEMREWERSMAERQGKFFNAVPWKEEVYRKVEEALRVEEDNGGGKDV